MHLQVHVPHHQVLTPSSHQTKATLKLLSSKEDWQKANVYLKVNVVPRVLQACSVEEKNSILADGIYTYFATAHDVRQTTTRKRKVPSHGNHDRALKVSELKKKARKEFRQARREGKVVEEIQSLARNFFNLIRQHSSLKKKSQRLSETGSAKKARKWCHRDFWRFTRELLNEDAASRVPPQFSVDEAYDYFASTYQSTPSTFTRPSWTPSELGTHSL